MNAPVTVTLKPGNDLTAPEIADCYELIAHSGFPFPPGVLESVHLVHNPMMVLAHQDDQLIGLQAYSTYQVQTPLKRKEMTLIYGGLGFQHPGTAKQGVAQRMVFHYMRHTFGPFWPVRSYAIMLGTHNPRLIQLLGTQHQLYLHTDNTLTPSISRFVQDFVRQKRSNPFPINEQLVVSPGAVWAKVEITEKQWALLYRSPDEKFNQMVHDLNLVEEIDGRRYLVGKYVLVLGHSSRSRLLKAVWKNGSRWVRKRLRSTASKPQFAINDPVKGHAYRN